MRARASRSGVVLGVLLLAATASCIAPVPGAAPSGGQRTVLVDNGRAYQTTTMPASEAEFAAPATRVWTALEGAYRALGIPVVLNDPRNHHIGNTNFFRSRRMDGQPLSRYADCGNSPEGPRADNSRVYFSMVTSLTIVDSTHTRLNTSVSPVAVDLSGEDNDRVTCGTTGELEKLLYSTVNRELGGGSGS
jgi:hypothetical protein